MENNRPDEPGWPAVVSDAQSVFQKWQETRLKTPENPEQRKTSLPPYHHLLGRAKGFHTSIQIQNILLNLTVAAFHISMLEMVSICPCIFLEQSDKSFS